MTGRRVRRITSGDLLERVDTGDVAEVVYATDLECHAIQLQNTVWGEEPRHLVFVGLEPEREVRELMEALDELLGVLSRERVQRRQLVKLDQPVGP